MDDKTILLKIDLDASALKASAKQAEENLKQLTPRLKELEATAGKNTLEYRKLNAEVKANQKTLQDNATALHRYESLQKSNNGSLKSMRELLSASKVAYSELTKEQRENEAVGGKLVKEMDDLNNQLLEAEKAYGTHTRNVGNYAGALTDLKAEIKSLKGQMATMDAGSAEYQQAAKRAGELNDKLKEVNENTKANTGGTGFEKMSNNLGLIKDDLMNLDFAGVSEKMKQMAVISSSMTFASATAGLKAMGVALLNLGKALLTNPLFWIAGAIVAVVAALKMWSDNVRQDAIRAQDEHTASLQRNIDAMQREIDLNKERSSLDLRLAELQGKNAKEIGKLRLKAFDDEMKENERLRKKWDNQAYNLSKQLNREMDDERRSELKSKLQEAKDNEQKLWDAYLISGQQRIVLEAEINKSIIDEDKNSNEKRKADAEKYAEQRLAIERRLSDLLLGNAELSHANEKALIEARYKFLEDTAKDNIDELIRLESNKNDELTALDKKEKADRINRINEATKREITDANGNKKIIEEIEKQKKLQLDTIDIEFKNRANDRETEYNNKVKENEKKKVQQAQQTADEIELISVKLDLAKAKGTDNEWLFQLRLYSLQKKQIEENAKREIELKKATGKEKELIEKQTQQKIQELNDATFNKNKENEVKTVELTKEQKKQLAIEVINSANQLAQSLMQISQNQIQQELNDEKDKHDSKLQLLQQQLDNGIISQANFNAQKSQLDSEYAQKEKELKEKQFKNNKAMQLINATIATAVGVANALGTQPPPLGLIMAGIAGALGAAQIAIIASQPTPKFAQGGILNGESHANGGIKTPYGELEGGEAVINKRSTAMFAPLLSAINVAGGGKKFANGGILQPITNSVESNLAMTNALIRAMQTLPNPVVSVTDIATVSNRVSVVTNRATL